MKLQLNPKHFGNKEYIYWKKYSSKVVIGSALIMSAEWIFFRPSIIIKTGAILFYIVMIGGIYYDAKHGTDDRKQPKKVHIQKL